MATADTRRQDLGIWALAALVFLWRLVAAASPFREGETMSMTSDSLNVRLALGVMGMVFLVCGLIVLTRSRDRSARLFALHLLAGGLHWGGPIALSPAPLETSLALLYLVVSGLLGETVLLQACCRFTSTWETLGRVRWLVLYAPAALAVSMSLAIGLLPSQSALSTSLVSFMPVFLVLPMAFSIVALGVLLYRAARPVSQGPARWKPVSLAAALVLSSLPSLLGAPDVYNLGFVIVPLTLTYVVTRS